MLTAILLILGLLPGPDTTRQAPMPKPRPSIGIAAMGVNTWQGWQPLVGVVGIVPLFKGKWVVEGRVGIGYSSTLDKSRNLQVPVEYSIPRVGTAWDITRTNRNLAASLSLLRIIPLSKTFSLGIGATGMFTTNFRHMAFNVVPVLFDTTLQPFNRNGAYRFDIRQLDTLVDQWSALGRLSVRYKVSDRINLEFGLEAGLSYYAMRRFLQYDTYIVLNKGPGVTWGDYRPFTSVTNFNPFDFTDYRIDYRGSLIQDYIGRSQPAYLTQTTIFSLQSVFLNLTYSF